MKSSSAWLELSGTGPRGRSAARCKKQKGQDLTKRKSEEKFFKEERISARACCGAGGEDTAQSRSWQEESRR